MPCCAPKDIPYKGLVISIAWDSDYVTIYDFDPVSDCHCVLLKSGYMSVEEAKAWIDGKRAVDEVLEAIIEKLQEDE